MTKVMVVDDDPILRKITVMALQRDGMEVSDAESGAQALDLYDDSFDVLVLDLMMPDMDGVTLLERMQAINPAVKAAFLTARHDQDEALLARGACGVLRKPYDPAALGPQLREMAGL